MAFGMIKDPKDLKPTNRTLNEKEEQLFNEENFARCGFCSIAKIIRGRLE